VQSGLARRLVAEGLGTAFLLMAVVGSGIMGEKLAGGNAGLTLLANSIATGAALAALIVAFGPISGAHFNPLVTLSEVSAGRLDWRETAPYVTVQVAGAFLGVALAHAMFGRPLFFASQHAREGGAQLLAEGIATLGLLSIIRGGAKGAPTTLGFAVGGYITAAYWFTSSTSFTNPAVTLARAASDTFVGIRPADVPGFLVAQVAGAGAAILLFRWLIPSDRSYTAR
jgi:glycerol uptake facilitator-like aquaporin